MLVSLKFVLLCYHYGIVLLFEHDFHLLCDMKTAAQFCKEATSIVQVLKSEFRMQI